MTETDAPQGSTYPPGIVFGPGSDRGVASDLVVTDVFQAAVGTSYVADVWARRVRSVMTDGLRDYVQWFYAPAARQGRIAAADDFRVARDLGPGHTVVTILCDGGARYQSKLFNPAFLREKGLPADDENYAIAEVQLHDTNNRLVSFGKPAVGPPPYKINDGRFAPSGTAWNDTDWSVVLRAPGRPTPSLSIWRLRSGSTAPRRTSRRTRTPTRSTTPSTVRTGFLTPRSRL